METKTKIKIGMLARYHGKLVYVSDLEKEGRLARIWDTDYGYPTWSKVVPVCLLTEA